MNTYIVDRSALSSNIEKLKRYAGKAKIYGVIKGNGYGLGLLRMAGILRECGINAFAVTEIHEIRNLREHGFETEEILMLRETALPEELDQLLELNAVATVGNNECAIAMTNAAKKARRSFPCHVKIDTGMGRYGFKPADEASLCAIYENTNLEIRGIYTHFHSAYSNMDATQQQFNAFMKTCSFISSKGYSTGTRHCCNSNAFLNNPEMHLDAVRIGSAFLGRLAFKDKLDLQRIGWCESRVESLRTLEAGDTVGYGAGWKAKQCTEIAVFGVGYYHGFGTSHEDDLFRLRDCLRNAYGWLRNYLKRKTFYVTVNGVRANVIGHIGMVQTVVDVTGLQCKTGDKIRIEINPLMLKNVEITEI